MPGGSRSLPVRPSLRHLKLEAKRRVAAGEFPSLHEAQAAIAWEHGLPSWATLKQLVGAAGNGNGAGDGQAEGQQSHALAQLRWVMSRFGGAGQPGWTAPADDELREHFDDRFLSVLPPDALVATISQVAADLRGGEFAVLGQAPFQAHVELNGVQYIAVVQDEPPHRLTGLRALPVGSRVRDARIANPPVRAVGEVPAAVPAIAGQAFAELGLVALLIAGGAHRDQSPWVLALGWADLDRGQALDPGHRFPAPGVTMLVTVTAVLRLAADNAITLDRPANDQLRSVRLADDTITVRELLTHTAGVDSPTELYADRVTELAELMGPVIACTGPRGVLQPSNGGGAVLGQLVADVTGMPYAEAATRLVLEPLKLSDSSFPARPPGTDPDIRPGIGPGIGGPGAVTGYNLTFNGMFEPIPARMPTLQAVAGLWSTGADLVRLGLGWSSLLPGALAHEALSPQARQAPPAEPSHPKDPGAGAGLGWLLNTRAQVAAHAGAGLEGTACLTVRTTDHRTHVVLTSRMIPVNSIETRLQAAGE